MLPKNFVSKIPHDKTKVASYFKGFYTKYVPPIQTRIDIHSAAAQKAENLKQQSGQKK